MTGTECQLINFVARQLEVFGRLVQDFVSPAGYFRETQNALHYAIYLHESKYLPYINNEKPHAKSLKYKSRFESLNRIDLILFESDTMVVPRVSEQFGEVDSRGQEVHTRDTVLYQNDTIGLKTLDLEGKVFLREHPGGHLEYGDDYILSEFIPFLFKDGYK